MALITSYATEGSLVRTPTRRVFVGLAIVLAVVAPYAVTRYTLTIINLVLLAVPGAVALNLLMGVAGLVSIGNAAFMGIGAFSAAIFGTQLGLPFYLVVPIAGIVSGALGALVGLPALRLRGFYLAIATLAFHFIAVYALNEYQLDHTGPAGFRLDAVVGGNPTVASWARTWYFLLLPFAAASVVFTWNLMRSRFGRAWKAIHHHDLAAELVGVNVTRYKVLAFTVTSFIIGLQGAVFAYYFGSVLAETYNFELAVRFIAMIVIGGMGSLLGAVLGATFVTALPFGVKEFFDSVPEGFLGVGSQNLFDVQVLIYGMFIVIFILFEPQGLAALWRRFRTSATAWPFSKEPDS